MKRFFTPLFECLVTPRSQLVVYPVIFVLVFFQMNSLLGPSRFGEVIILSIAGLIGVAGYKWLRGGLFGWDSGESSRERPRGPLIAFGAAALLICLAILLGTLLPLIEPAPGDVAV